MNAKYIDTAKNEHTLSTFSAFFYDTKFDAISSFSPLVFQSL